MKVCYLLLLSLCAFSCSINQSALRLPAGQDMELDYPGYDVYRARLKNKSLQGLEVAVRSKSDEAQVRGFGLGPKGKAEVLVEAENKLILRNQSEQDINLGFRVSPTERKKEVRRDNNYISFTLWNKSARSIPLLIPSVMNPNLSPFSKSGVGLAIGQEILFRENGKKYVLLTVDDSILEGSEVDVAELLEQRKKALGL